MLDQKTTHARALFGRIARAYDGPAQALSLGRYGRWRRALVRALELAPDARVLDVASGTGLIARDIENRYGCSPIALDQSTDMLQRAGQHGLTIVAASADQIPFPAHSFDAVAFSYLLRYVTDPNHTLRELVRVTKPGGTIASVEFSVPRARLARFGWRAYTVGLFPVFCRLFGKGWREVGRFLPHSIVAWIDEWPIERQIAAWRDSGIEDVRAREMTLGTAVIIAGRAHG